MRPDNLSKDDSTSESGWLHAIKYLDNQKIKFDTVIAVQATSPLRESKDIKTAIRKYYKNKYDSLFTGSINNEIFFNWSEKLMKISPNYNIRKRIRRQNLKNSILENGSFYIFDKKNFQKNKNRLFGKIGFHLMSKIKSFQIDDLNDFEIIKSIMSNKKIMKNFNKFF